MKLNLVNVQNEQVWMKYIYCCYCALMENLKCMDRVWIEFCGYICGGFAFLISFRSSFNVYIGVILLKGDILIVVFYVQVH